MRNLLLLLVASLVLNACNPLGNDDPHQSTNQSASSSDAAISEVRNNPASSPVANYEKKAKNDLNEWYFRVKLYETKKRFVYRMVMEYETINEEKEITFPNLNEEPKPEIRPGSREYDAIVGFTDNKGEFKEYIDVFVQNENLRVRTLKYYAVTEKEAN